MMHLGSNHFGARHLCARHLHGIRALNGGGVAGHRAGQSRGWANERAILEASFQRAKEIVSKSPNKTAKRVTRKLNQYLSNDIEIGEISSAVDALKIEVQKRESLRLELQAATLELEAFIQDEQETIQVLMMAMEYDEECLLIQMI